MTNQNTTGPALHRQNQPPDSGSLHESQRRHLRLSLHRSHRNTCCVCFCVKSVLQFPRREEAKSLLLVLQPPKVRFFWWQIKTQQAQPLTTRTNLLTLALYMSHGSTSFGYRCIAVTAIHAVWKSVLQFSVERSGTTDMSRRPKIFVKPAIWKSWAKILSRGHISGHLKILGRFLGNIFTHKKWNEILLGKSWVRSRFLYKILFP